MRLLKALSVLFALGLLAAPAAFASHGSSSPNGSHEDPDSGEETYVAADGDPSNSEQTDGWIRVDGGGFAACSAQDASDDKGDSTAKSCDDDALTTVP